MAKTFSVPKKKVLVWYKKNKYRKWVKHFYIFQAENSFWGPIYIIGCIFSIYILEGKSDHLKLILYRKPHIYLNTKILVAFSIWNGIFSAFWNKSCTLWSMINLRAFSTSFTERGYIYKQNDITRLVWKFW